MQKHRQTTLFKLYPVEDFAFCKTGTVYTLRKRDVDQKRDRYILTLRKKGQRRDITRYFTFDQMIKTFVYLKTDLRISQQPQSSICFTCSNT